MPGRSGFFREMTRRHVWRAVVAYAVAGWLLVQIATQVFPVFNLPGWTVQLVVVAIALGFPVVATLAWVFEITPEGMRRTEPADSPAARELHDTRAVGRRFNTVIIVVLTIAVIVLLGNQFMWRKGAGLGSGADRAAIPEQSIAVLPFENLSDDKANEYFAAGMQDLILTRLADIGELKVISRASTMKYKSRPDNLRQVAAELGVATILEGSVQKQGNQVLISMQLIDARTDTHLWAESYQRTLDNVFGVEGEVAEKIAAALHAKLSPTQAAKLAALPTADPAAYDLFLQAEFQRHRGFLDSDPASFRAAIPLYRQAIGSDPGFALAWAQLSFSESALAWWGGGGGDVETLNAQARTDARHALQLAPQLAAAHMAIGYSDYWGRRDYAAALKAFDAALALRRNDPYALAARGFVERRQGRFDDAIASFSRAVSRDPRNFTITFELGDTSMMIGHYAEAEAWYKRSLALAPDSVAAKVRYSTAIVLGSGDIPRALDTADGDATLLKSQRVKLLVWQRKFPDAIALLESIPDTPDNFSARDGSKAWQLANVHWQAGDRVRAASLFEQALSEERAQLPQVQGLDLATVWIGVGYAELGTGNTAAGLAAIAKSQAILASTHDSVLVPGMMVWNAAGYAMAGRPDPAMPLLARALATPGVGFSYSPALLWLDPAWDPIRDDPRFQALLKQYAKYKPSLTYDTPSAS